MKEKYPSVETSELEECYDQILELKEQGRLFSEDTIWTYGRTVKG